jgi:peptidyl-prolyl cis-trans isomerase C
VTKTKTLFITLALAATAAVAQDKPTPAPAQVKPAATATAAEADPVIISAGAVTIRKSDFEAAIKTLPEQYQQYAMGPGRKQFAEDYLRMKLLAAEGMKAGLDKSPQVLRQIDLMKENLVATEQLKKLETGITVSDADLKKAYDEHKSEYEQVKAKHILIAPKGSAAAQPGRKELTDDEAKAKAEDIRKRIVAGEKFEDVAKKESDDLESGKAGGELGSFGHGQMVQQFEAAAFAAKPGEITPVVKTEFGYHIIKVEDHTFSPMADQKTNLDKEIRQKKLREAIDAMKDSAKPTFNDAYFAVPAAADAKPAEPEVKKQ